MLCISIYVPRGFSQRCVAFNECLDAILSYTLVHARYNTESVGSTSSLSFRGYRENTRDDTIPGCCWTLGMPSSVRRRGLLVDDFDVKHLVVGPHQHSPYRPHSAPCTPLVRSVTGAYSDPPPLRAKERVTERKRTPPRIQSNPATTAGFSASWFSCAFLWRRGGSLFFGTVPEAIRHFTEIGHTPPPGQVPTDFFLQASRSRLSLSRCVGGITVVAVRSVNRWAGQ